MVKNGKATLVLGRMCATWGKILPYCRIFMDNTGLLVEAELVIAPSDLHAAEPLHNEPRDQFIFITEGSKHFLIYEPKFPLPRPEQVIGKWGHEVERNDIGDVAFEGVLEEGDMVYIPRGFVYTTSSMSMGSSVHLSIGILTEERMFTSYDNVFLCAAAMKEDHKLFNAIQELLRKPEAFQYRRALPIGFLSTHFLNIDFDNEAGDIETKEVLKLMLGLPKSNYTAAIPFLFDKMLNEFTSLLESATSELEGTIELNLAKESLTIFTSFQHARISEWEVIYSPEKYNRIPSVKRPGRTWFLTRHQTKKMLESFCKITIDDEKYLDPPETEENTVRGKPLTMEEMFPDGQTYSVIDEYDPRKEQEEWEKRKAAMDAYQDEPWEEEL